jgi:phage shock protein E
MAIDMNTIPDEGSISKEEAKKRVQENADIFVLDVRVPEEGKEYTENIPCAARIPLPELEQRLDEIPTNRPVIVHCIFGGKASKAYAILKEKRPDISDLCFVKTAEGYK